MTDTVPPGASTPGGIVLPRYFPSGRWGRAWGGVFDGHPHRFDLMLAVVIYAATVIGLGSAARIGFGELPPAWVYLTSAAACAVLVLRRNYPWLVLVVTVVGYLILQNFVQEVPPLIMAVVAALVTLTLAGRRTAAILAAGVITIAAAVVGSLLDTAFWLHPRPVATAAICALSIAFADALRNRRAYVLAIQERARRAEESREQEARRQVGDERLRIARELHDVVAHHIAVINVQAGVAGHLLSRNPDQAREALDHVREAARSVLSEMQAVVTVLREPGDAVGGSVPAEPLPGLHRMGDLLQEFRAAGLTIDSVVRGSPVPLPAAVDLVAYRAIQESLTNVGKHAAGAPAVVDLSYRPDLLAITVTNEPVSAAPCPVAQDSSPTGGFGLIGMRERVGSVHGDLWAGPTVNGGFSTALLLPLDGSPVPPGSARPVPSAHPQKADLR